MPLDSTLIDTDWDSDNFSWDNYADIIRKIGPDQEYVTFVNKDWKKIQISLLDLWNIWDYSDDEISEMLHSILGVTIQSPEWLKLVNILAEKALNYLKTELFYTEQELRGVWNVRFNSSAEIIRFFKSTNNSQWLKKCMLAKVAMLYQEGVWYNVELKRQKTLDVMENKVVRSLEDLAKKSSLGFDDEIMREFDVDWKSEFEGSFFVENADTKISKKIIFKVEFREKSIEATISKALRDKNYRNQWDIMDLLWIRIFTRNPEDKLLLMSYISQLAFKYWEYRIKNKDWVTPFDLWTVIDESDYFQRNTNTAEFIRKLWESFDKIEKKASTALNYSDIKFVPIGDWNNLSFEIMFLDEWHKNNHWLAHHKCFEFMRKIPERIRLEWFVSFKALKILSSTLINSIAKSSVKDLDWVQPTDLLRDILLDIYDQFPNAIDSGETKDSIKHMKKLELMKKLERALPIFYTSKLIIFKDSKWRSSAANKKYTNRLWIDNLSVLLDEENFREIV